MSLEDVARPIRETLRADGADLEFDREEGGTAYFRLNLEQASCLECVMPRQMLEEITLHAIQRELPTLEAVHIHDPRETAEETA